MANIPIETITKNNDGNTYIIKDANAIPKTGSNQISGDLIPATDNTVSLGSISYNFEYINTKFLSSNSDLNLYSSFNGNTTGSFLTLQKIDSTSGSGSFQLNAHTETQIAQLIGYPDGTLTWGGTVFTNGIKTYSIESRDTSNSSVLYLLGGNSYPNGAQINLYGNNHQSNGCFEIIAHGDTHYLRGDASGTLSWSGTSIVPANNNACDLGTSTYKWKSVNGIAPDELGLPTSTYTDVSSYITNFDSTPNTFTAPVSGLLFIMGTDTLNVRECAIFNDTKGYRTNLSYVYFNIRGFIPVEKGDNISVFINGSLNDFSAKIYHLKGKV